MVGWLDEMEEEEELGGTVKEETERDPHPSLPAGFTFYLVCHRAQAQTSETL